MIAGEQRLLAQLEAEGLVANAVVRPPYPAEGSDLCGTPCQGDKFSTVNALTPCTLTPCDSEHGRDTQKEDKSPPDEQTASRPWTPSTHLWKMPQDPHPQQASCGEKSSPELQCVTCIN